MASSWHWRNNSSMWCCYPRKKRNTSPNGSCFQTVLFLRWIKLGNLPGWKWWRNGKNSIVMYEKKFLISISSLGKFWKFCLNWFVVAFLKGFPRRLIKGDYNITNLIHLYRLIHKHTPTQKQRTNCNNNELNLHSLRHII